MNVASKRYQIYDQKTGRFVASIGPAGILEGQGDPEAVKQLQALMQRDIVIRESLLEGHAGEESEGYDPFPEENMCYFGLITLRPGDPAYLAAFVRRLPYISYYEARPVEE